MTGATAQFFVKLSHQWTLPALLLPVACGALAYYVDGRSRRVRDGAIAPTRRFSLMVRAISYVLFMMSLLICAASFLHIGCAVMKAQSAECISNEKQLSAGVAMYAQDYDERLPSAMRWAEAIDTKVKEAARNASTTLRDPFHCPAADTPASYGMNELLGTKNLSDIDTPNSTVLLFEADALKRSFAGSAENVAWMRHGGMPDMAFADGHVKWVNHSTSHDLLWSPTPTSRTPQVEPER